MTTQMSSREFNQQTSRAKQAAAGGPVFITDRGRPSHVLLTYEAYETLTGANHLLDRLAEPAGVELVELVVSASRETARPAEFD